MSDKWEKLRHVTIDQLVTQVKLNGSAGGVDGFTTPEGWRFVVAVAVGAPGNERAVELVEGALNEVGKLASFSLKARKPMSDEIEARLKAIEKRLDGYPGLGAAADIKWLIATVREQKARADTLSNGRNYMAEAARLPGMRQRAEAAESAVSRLENDLAGMRAELGDGPNPAASRRQLRKQVDELAARAEATKNQLDASEKACAAMRGALVQVVEWGEERHAEPGHVRMVDAAQDALATTAGLGWLSPEKAETLDLECDRHERQAAAVRAALKQVFELAIEDDHIGHEDECPGGEECECPLMNAMDAALRTDAGKDWVPRAEIEWIRDKERQRCAEIVRESWPQATKVVARILGGE